MVAVTGALVLDYILGCKRGLVLDYIFGCNRGLVLDYALLWNLNPDFNSSLHVFISVNCSITPLFIDNWYELLKHTPACCCRWQLLDYTMLEVIEVNCFYCTPACWFFIRAVFVFVQPGLPIRLVSR